MLNHFCKGPMGFCGALFFLQCIKDNLIDYFCIVMREKMLNHFCKGAMGKRRAPYFSFVINYICYRLKSFALIKC